MSDSQVTDLLPLIPGRKVPDLKLHMHNTGRLEGAVGSIDRLIARLLAIVARERSGQRSQHKLWDNHILKEIGAARDSRGLREFELDRITRWKAKGHPGGF